MCEPIRPLVGILCSLSFLAFSHPAFPSALTVGSAVVGLADVSRTSSPQPLSRLSTSVCSLGSFAHSQLLTWPLSRGLRPGPLLGWASRVHPVGEHCTLTAASNVLLARVADLGHLYAVSSSFSPCLLSCCFCWLPARRLTMLSPEPGVSWPQCFAATGCSG